ncbi:LysR family transcriptional regulator [Salinicola sp. JS01]|uniref:LysR family transcriptional regulator n=1 Tax=Salinicola sp. JS01 TaxID=3050071 RepID=UPI00255B6303|nr:LysR family transcriptional regulator [Salinicola sp. JS01]WIX31327.1 LysR family transcriptional regulator [Salinicola sp. JS01]
MDTQSLQAFIAVADTASFSLAGERLHLTQPAISKRIAALEAQTDAKLFDRINRRVSLTEAGRLLLPQARRILQLVEESRRQLHDLSGQVAGSLTLATSHHVGLHRLPPVLKAYTRRYPGVDLDLRFLDSEQAYQGVVSGAIELAVVTLAPRPNPQVESVPVWTDHLRFVAAPEHPLAGAGRVSLGELASHPAVLPGPLTFTRDIVVDAFSQAGLAISVALSTNYLETLKMMAGIGLGWSVLPESMIDAEVTVLAVDHPPLVRRLGYLVHRERTLSNAGRAMLAQLEAARPDLAETPDQT